MIQQVPAYLSVSSGKPDLIFNDSRFQIEMSRTTFSMNLFYSLKPRVLSVDYMVSNVHNFPVQ